MFFMGRTWGLGFSGKAQKKKWLGSNTIFQDKLEYRYCAKIDLKEKILTLYKVSVN